MMPRLAHDRRVQRVRAILDLFRGEPVAEVSKRHQIGRSDLYKFRRRALTAMEEALADRRRGPRRSPNRVASEREAQVVALCKRHPTLSSYAVRRRYGTGAPSARTIQRIRLRHGLGRFSKREPPRAKRRQLRPEARARVAAILTEKPYLGPDRTVWDLQNAEGITISPSTLKRMKRKRRDARLPPRPPKPEWRFYERRHPHSLWHGDFLEKITLTDLDETAYQLTLQDDYSRGYVFCDLFLNPDNRATIRSLITAMRAWQVIPKAVVFDNAPQFKGRLLSAFCTGIGTRLIHSAPYHPQTNGKLERAFRDDMRDFYKRYDSWLLEPLRRDLPDYVHYRNYVRGHYALGGKPAITRLNECSDKAEPALLEQLENYARCKVRRQIIPATGSIRLFNRDARLGKIAANTEVTFYESLEGLEAWIDGERTAVLKDYQTFRQLKASWRLDELPRAFRFEPCGPVICPRIAVAA
jgi:transposase InsO family protein